MKRNEILYELAIFFKEKDQPVHITLISGQWLNGKIISINEDFKDRLILIEEQYGEMLIFFDRIIDDGIKPRKQKE